MPNILDITTQYWVRLSGQRIDPLTTEWLLGPKGDTDIIGDKFISRLATKEDLKIEKNKPEFGLLENFSELGFSEYEQAQLNPKVKDFHENTFSYDFEVWSEWRGIFRPFGWLLSILFSKRLQQLNLPLSSLDSAKGMESNIIKLTKEGMTKWTIWFRKLKSNNRVVYSVRVGIR